MYLMAPASTPLTRDALTRRSDLGVLVTPASNRLLVLTSYAQHWAADTGCFLHPERYADDTYLAWLEGMARRRDLCLFATAPDVVGNAAATIEAALPMLPRIRATGYRAAFVGQDGLERLTVPWDAFDCLFIGGTTAWKLSTATVALVKEAKRRGKWCHMGRVNSGLRLRAAAAAGYDSADGTCVGFAPDKNLAKVMGWLDHLERLRTGPRQLSLFAEESS